MSDASYTAEQRQYFKAEYSRRRKRRLWVGIGSFAVIGITVSLWLALAPQGMAAFGCVIAFVVVSSLLMVLSMALWTCPACGKPLGREWNYNYCPNCGVELKDADRMSL